LNVDLINSTTYSDLLLVLGDEADWPFCSWSTGYVDPSQCPFFMLPVDSMYTKMRRRNLCNHRDFQNIGVNGGRSGNMKPPNGIIMDIARSADDQPATVFYSLIGNDVCDKGTDYTPLDDFKNSTLQSFAYLDTLLPPNSDVIAMGLVDGRILYDTMHALPHPLGPTYADVYDYLNCLVVSPCFGYMNTNETIREQTAAYAFQLNAIYPEIIKQNTYQNFNLSYFFPDFVGIVKKWVAGGGKASDLIELTDGFHPSQTGNMLLAEQYWDWLAVNVPRAIGDVNPNNAQITATFGDQGGY